MVPRLPTELGANKKVGIFHSWELGSGGGAATYGRSNERAQNLDALSDGPRT